MRLLTCSYWFNRGISYMITMPQSTPISTHITKDLYDCVKHIYWLIKINLKFFLYNHQYKYLESKHMRDILGFLSQQLSTHLFHSESISFWKARCTFDLSMQTNGILVKIAQHHPLMSSSPHLQVIISNYFYGLFTHLPSRQSVHKFIALIVNFNTGEFLQKYNMQNHLLFEHLLQPCL